MDAKSKKALSLLVLSMMIIGAMGCKANKNNKEISTDTILMKAEFSEEDMHIVSKGETLRKISKKRYGSSKYWREIALLNQIKNPDLIKVGQKLYLPDLATLLNYCYDVEIYIVLKGDTLYDLCKKYYGDTRVSTICKLATYNNLEDPNIIRTGQKLLFPSKEDLNKIKTNDYTGLYPKTEDTKTGDKKMVLKP